MKNIVLKKGHDIKMSGVPSNKSFSEIPSLSVALMPNQFRGVKPKLTVSEGEKVKIGQALFFDKTKPDVKWASPANGIIKEITIINKLDNPVKYKVLNFSKPNLKVVFFLIIIP